MVLKSIQICLVYTKQIAVAITTAITRQHHYYSPPQPPPLLLLLLLYRSVPATASIVSGLSRRALNVTTCLNLLVLNSRIFMDLTVIENGAENGDPEIEQSLYLGKIPNMIIKRSC